MTTMKRFLSLAMAFCVAVTLSLDVNAAKRFGGGKSMGSAPSHQTRQAQPNAAPNSPTAAGPAATGAAAGAAGAAAKSGASRWLGPLAGLAAGGLLASMFMGDGFQGMQFLDILIIALIAFIAFRFIASRRRQQQGNQPAMAGGHAPMQREMPATPPSIFGGASRPVMDSRPVINAPSWFDETRFVAAAREHFMSLQQHWMPTRWTRSPSSSPRRCCSSSSRSALTWATATSPPTSTTSTCSWRAWMTRPRRPSPP
jgi:hypothetical protein